MNTAALRWPVRLGEPGTSARQHGLHRPGVIEIETATRVLTASAKLERINGRPSDEPLQGGDDIVSVDRVLDTTSIARF